jgi:HK97 family phage major capsid protein
VSLNVFKASSKIVAVPYELLQDTTIDMEAFIRNRLAQRLGRLGNTAFTVGTGTTQPDGIVPKATSGTVGTTGQTLTIIYDDLVNLVHSVDPAYRSVVARS